jgi:uncharacterized RDD family membrane protein YckC
MSEELYEDIVRRYSLAELLDVKSHINEDRFPDRYDLVVSEIARRTTRNTAGEEPSVPGESAESYKDVLKTYSPHELLDVKSHISEDKYPERYKLLVSEISRRPVKPVQSEAQPVAVQKYSTFWRRYWASAIDWAILSSISPIAFGGGDPSSVQWSLLLVLQLLGAAYSILMHGFYGQTVGKMVTRVKVLSVTENKLSMMQAVMRDVVPLVFVLFAYAFSIDIAAGRLTSENLPAAAWVSSPVGVWLFLQLGWSFADGLTLIISAKRRAIHDLIARSIVVKTKKNPR